MSGLLTNLFDGGGESAQSQSHDAALAAGQELDLGVDVGVGVEAGGSYETPDGATHSWSSSHDVGLDADVDAAAQAILSTGVDQSSVDADA